MTLVTGSEISFKGEEITATLAVVLDVSIDETGYVSITVLPWHDEAIVIASGGHFGGTFWLEGSVQIQVEVIS